MANHGKYTHLGLNTYQSTENTDMIILRNPSDVARKENQPSKTCPVFGKVLNPGEAMTRFGCTYICDEGKFVKRDCKRQKTPILLHGTRGKFW